MESEARREHIVEIAKKWIGTPYHHKGRKKHVGCDCLTFIAGVYEEAGLIDHIEFPHYAMQWNLHRREETYYDGLKKFGREISAEDAQPGDIILWKIGMTYSHAAIMIDVGKIIHSVSTRNMGVMIEELKTAVWLTHDKAMVPRPVKYFTFW